MARYGWDASSRNFARRGYGPRYGGDYTVHGFYSGPSRYWGRGYFGNTYGESDYGRSRQGGGYQGARGGRSGFGYYGRGLDQGLSSYYSGTYQSHGPIGESPARGGTIHSPAYRGQGRGPRGGPGRSRYDRGW